MRWYLSGLCDCFVILDRMISPFTRSRAPEVVVACTEGDGPDVYLPLSPYSMVLAWSRRCFGTSEPLSRFLGTIELAVSCSSVSAPVLGFWFEVTYIVWLSSSWRTLRAGGFTFSNVMVCFFAAPYDCNLSRLAARLGSCVRVEKVSRMY